MTTIPRHFSRSTCAVAALLLFSSFSIAAEPVSFERYDYGTRGRPLEVGSADFNVDGVLDIAVLNRGHLRILYGEGAGVFGKARRLTGGRIPTDLAIDYYNSDERPDAAILTFHGVRVNCGTLDDKMGLSSFLEMEYAFLCLASGDSNRDGFVDIFAGRLTLSGGFWGINNAEYSIRVFAGLGDGTFVRGDYYPVGKTPTTMFFRDMNDDTFGDLVIADAANGGSLSVLYGNAEGGFEAAVDFPAPVTYSMTCADFDDDGFPDVALTDVPGGRFAVLYGSAAGFAAPVYYAFEGVRSAVTSGDFDADGLIDLAVCKGTRDAFVTVFYGQEGGGFGQATDCPVKRSPCSITAADLDDDGDLDLAVTSRAQRKVSVLLNQGP